MADIHLATTSRLTRELVRDVRNFITREFAYIANQAAAVDPADPLGAARHALLMVMEATDDDLGIDFALTLAEHELMRKVSGE